jgi:alpha-L-fucosidase
MATGRDVYVRSLRDEPIVFNVIRLEEPIRYGRRIARYRVMAFNDESREWFEASSGSTVGYRKLDRTFTIQTTRVRLVIEEALGPPAVSTPGLHLDKNSDLGTRYVLFSN